MVWGPYWICLFIIIIIRDREHRWCEDPIESALFIIIIIIIIILFFFSKPNRILRA